MFQWIKNFIYKNKNKFFIAGALISGVTLLGKYAEWKVYEFHTKETKGLLEKQKRRQHYEKTRQTAKTTVCNLSSSVCAVIEQELDTDSILAAIKTQPNQKVELWQELKVVGVSRCIAAIYSAALMSAAVQVHLMLLGGSTFENVCSNGTTYGVKAIKVTSKVQERYLASIQFFVEQGLPAMLKSITAAVRSVVSGLPLNRKLNIHQLEVILRDIILELESEGDSKSKDDVKVGCGRKLGSWSSYVVAGERPSLSDNDGNHVYDLLLETADVLDTSDFQCLMQCLIQLGLNTLLDNVAEAFPSIHTPSHATDANQSNVIFHTEATLPVAKIIPILTGLFHTTLSTQPGHLLQFLLANDNLEVLSFNIYEAFSSSVDF